MRIAGRKRRSRGRRAAGCVRFGISAARAGGNAVCIEGNMPCTGCFGPTSRVRDFGAKALSAIASVADSNDAQEIGRILSEVADPLGTFYRYSLPASLMARSRK